LSQPTLLEIRNQEDKRAVFTTEMKLTTRNILYDFPTKCVFHKAFETAVAVAYKCNINLIIYLRKWN
jgi:hypothetical protein